MALGPHERGGQVAVAPAAAAQVQHAQALDAQRHGRAAAIEPAQFEPSKPSHTPCTQQTMLDRQSSGQGAQEDGCRAPCCLTMLLDKRMHCMHGMAAPSMQRVKHERPAFQILRILQSRKGMRPVRDLLRQPRHEALQQGVRAAARCAC